MPAAEREGQKPNYYLDGEPITTGSIARPRLGAVLAALTKQKFSAVLNLNLGAAALDPHAAVNDPMLGGKDMEKIIGEPPEVTRAAKAKADKAEAKKDKKKASYILRDVVKTVAALQAAKAKADVKAGRGSCPPPPLPLPWPVSVGIPGA